MSETYELSAVTRTENGKGFSRRLRRLENKVPAIIYGGEKEPIMVSLDHNTFANILENEGFYSHIISLNVDGKKESVVLKDLQRHPSKPRILHADFQRISAKSKITMNVPLRFVGGESSPGVKNQNGIVSHLMNEVEIRCLPNDLPEFIEVDLSRLSIGDSIHLSELKIPKGVEIIALLQGEHQNQPVVSINKPVITAAPAEGEQAPEAEAEEGETET
jgi:large subunit ribosomal protein L25